LRNQFSNDFILVVVEGVQGEDSGIMSCKKLPSVTGVNTAAEHIAHAHVKILGEYKKIQPSS
jgi:hypothetical protein